MGFPSPAADYVEQTLTVSRLCQYDAKLSRPLETAAGYAIVDVCRRPSRVIMSLSHMPGKLNSLSSVGRR